MSISKTINSTIQYLSEAVARIFGPSDDAYPTIGIQPFAGEPFKQQHNAEW